MILVDTSIWIELLKKKPNISIKQEELFLFLICPPVVQEVLQGVKSATEFRKFEQSFLAFPMVGDPVSTETFRHAAELYRSARRVGLTIRSPTDCLVAAIAIENHVPIWHHDRDFERICQVSDLVLHQPL